MSTKKTVTPEEIKNDPLWQYSAYELKTMPPEKLKRLLHGPGGNRQFLPGMLEAFARKLRTWEPQK
jgi:hypothetical protein